MYCVSSYYVLYKAMRKYFGDGLASEWSTFVPEYIKIIHSGEAFSSYWLFVLDILDAIHINPQKGFMSSRLTSDGSIKVADKKQMLETTYLPCGYYVFSVYDFEETFFLQYFETKSEAQKNKSEQQKTESLFYITSFKI